MALDITTIRGFIGDTNNISMVPFSFSFTMDTEVIMAPSNMRIRVITPGTKLKVLDNFGLYNMLVSKSIE